MAKKWHSARLPRSILAILLIVLTAGGLVIAMSCLALRQLDTRQVLTSTGSYEGCDTQWIQNGKGADEVWLVTVDQLSCYVSPHVNSVLDRDALRSLTPGTVVTIRYTPDKGMRGIASTLQLLSLEADGKSILAYEDTLKESRQLQYWGVGLGGLLILLALAYCFIFKFSQRNLYKPSRHRKR